MAQALDLSRPPPPPIHPAFSERVLVFPHCPKTAGLTLASGLKGMFGPHYVRLKNPRALRKIAPEARSGIAAVSGHFSLPKAEAAIVPLLNREPLYVATVRDPVERARSAYSYIRRKYASDEERSRKLHAAYDDDINVFMEGWPDGDRMNLQCSFICGEPNAAAAIDCIESCYLAVASPVAVNSLVDMLAAALSLRRNTRPWWRSLLLRYKPLHENSSGSEQFVLRPEIEARVREANSEDQRLFAWVSTNQSRLLAEARRALREVATAAS